MQDNRPVTPLLSVDAVLFDSAGRLLLVRRRYPPFVGQHALPGGFVDVGERVEDAVRRELLEETGVTATVARLVGVYSDPARDPRRHNVSIAFLMTAADQIPVGGDDAASASFIDDWRRVPLAFDHRQIVDDAARLAGLD